MNDAVAHVVPLAQRPKAAEDIARWHFKEWGPYLEGEGFEERLERTRSWSRTDAIPFTMVAVLDDVPVGTASVVDHDMPDPPAACAPLAPWLSGVFVVPEHRKEGLGPLVVGACEEQAAALGHRILYLFTAPATAVKFYEPMGWQELLRTPYRGEEVVVMSKAL
jgi:GNAT superfamily N-acetyltransferase